MELLRARQDIYGLTVVRDIAEVGKKIRRLVVALKSEGFTREQLMGNTDWCFDCWQEDQRFVPSVETVEGDKLCASCAHIRRQEIEETGKVVRTMEPVEPEGKWTGLLNRMAGMKVRETITLMPGDIEVKKYANQLRSMTFQSKIVEDFKFSIETTTDKKVIVQKISMTGRPRTSVEKRDKAEDLIKSGLTNNKVAEEVGISRNTVSKIKQELPESPFEGMHNQNLCEKVADSLRGGMGINEAMEACGVSKAKVMAIEKRIINELPINCKCGEKRGHRGWCSDRLAKSPARQETVKMLQTTRHTQTHETVQEAIVQTNGHGPQSATEITLESGAKLRLELVGDVFQLCPKDRRFVLGLVDRIKFYEEYGNDAAEKGVLQKSSKKGEKLFTIQVPESYVEDMLNLMESEDRAAAVSAFLQGIGTETVNAG